MTIKKGILVVTEIGTGKSDEFGREILEKIEPPLIYNVDLEDFKILEAHSIHFYEEKLAEVVE